MDKLPDKKMLREVDKKVLGTFLEKMLDCLVKDFNAQMAEDIFTHTVDQLINLIPKRYPSITFGEMREVYLQINEGKLRVIKLSVHYLMDAITQYNNAKIERNRRKYDEKRKYIRSRRVNCANIPMGKALTFRLQMNKLGLNKYNDKSLKELAEMIRDGKIDINEELNTK